MKKEFLEKCLEQWEASANKSPIVSMIQLGSLFSAIRHRAAELEDGGNKIIVGKRRSGKTTDAILESEKTGYPILVRDRRMADYISFASR